MRIVLRGLAIAPILALLALPLMLPAQVNVTDSTLAQLQKRVSVSLEETTLPKLLANLSKQTGVKIRVVPSLQERILSLMMPTGTGENALEMLCEMGEWRWRETAPGEVIVERRNLRIPLEVAYVSRKTQSVLPADLREFLGAPKPSRDLRDENPQIFGDPKKDQERGSLVSKMRHIGYELGGGLEDTQFSKTLSHEKETLFKNLTPEQQESLITTLFFHELWTIQRDFIYGDPLPHLTDPTLTVIQLDTGNGMTLNYRLTNERGGMTITGFGAGVPNPFLKPGELPAGVSQFDPNKKP